MSAQNKVAIVGSGGAGHMHLAMAVALLVLDRTGEVVEFESAEAANILIEPQPQLNEIFQIEQRQVDDNLMERLNAIPHCKHCNASHYPNSRQCGYYLRKRNRR